MSFNFVDKKCNESYEKKTRIQIFTRASLIDDKSNLKANLHNKRTLKFQFAIDCYQ